MKIWHVKPMRHFCAALTAGLLTLLTCSAQTFQEKVVAAVLVGEAGDQGLRGMLAVAEVISTRSIKTHRTPLQVVTARNRQVCAFSCMNGTTAAGLVDRNRSSEVYKDALRLAALVCRTPSRLPGITRGATHFSRKDEKPYWARSKTPVLVLNDHAFYRLKI